jgi:hypothetical protein
MRQQVTNTFGNELGIARDVDVTTDGRWCAIFQRGSEQVIAFQGGDEIRKTPPIKFPIIRWVGNDHILVADTRIDSITSSNAWIYKSDGILQTTFCAGDAINDAVANKNAIVFTYFDEGVFGNIPPSNDGVAVFTLDGQLLFGYQSFFGESAVDVADCYCACRGDRDEVLFVPYTDFPLVRLNIATRSQKIEVLPEVLHGTRALVAIGDNLFFYGPYGQRSAIFEYKSGRDARLVDTHAGPLRGLTQGRFISVGEHEYTIVYATESA